jgi:hypothetical protein
VNPQNAMALGRLKRREFSRTIGSQLVLGCLFGGATYSHNTIAAKWFPMAESFIHKNLSDKRKEIQAYIGSYCVD